MVLIVLGTPFPVTDSDYRALQHMNVVLLTNIHVKWKLKRLQRIAHTTNFEPLLDSSEKSIQEMIFIISEVIEMLILNKVRQSSHFALMLDETTDCTVTEQLAI